MSKLTDYKELSKDDLVKKIEELESVIEVIEKEKNEYELLDFPWIGNLGQWYWMVQSDRVIFNEKKVINLGYQASEIPKEIGFQFFTERLHPEDYDRVMDNMRRHLYNETDAYDVEYRIRSKNGEYIWYYDRGKVTKRDTEGKPLIVSGIVFDITQNKMTESNLKEANSKLHKMAMTDELTGAFNRRMIVEAINNEIKRSKRLDSIFSLIMFDIDHFKMINDNFGHDAGDFVLKRLAQMVKNRIRVIDIFGRWGGEEFIIVLPSTELESTIILAEDLRIKLSQLDLEGIGRVTASFGIATYEEGDSIDSIVKKVDNKMYQAKNEGRNRVKY